MSTYANGTRVRLVVPFGTNAGKTTGFGLVVGFLSGGPDGDRYLVLSDGRVTEHAASWVKPANR